jgi:hypothetical protein
MPGRRSSSTDDTAAAEETSPAQPLGAADTDDPDAFVTSSRPDPTDNDLRTGRVAAVASVAPRPTGEPQLVLASEPRIEVFEQLAPGNVVVEITHNLDTGSRSYRWTDRTRLSREG